MTETKVDIIVTEDDPAVLRSLLKSLETQPNFNVVAQCASFAKGASASSSHKAEVVITDLQFPDGHGFDLIRLARKQTPSTETRVISFLGDEKSVVTAISAGASGFLLIDTQALNIVKNAHELLAGRSPISTSVARYIIRVVQQFEGLEVAEKILADRETDILWGIAKGYTYKDVADLGVRIPPAAATNEPEFRRFFCPVAGGS